jgi:hypothetical protein
MNDAYITEFVTKAKEAGFTPHGAARELMEETMEDFATTLVRILADVYKLEPWEMAQNVVYNRRGLSMSLKAGARALKYGLGLDAEAMAKMFHKLAFNPAGCKYMLEQVSFSEPTIKQAIKTTYNVG